MKIKRSLLALVSLTILATFAPAICAQGSTWDPHHTWVFMVGMVEWKDKESFDSFPADNRKDLVLLDTFKKRGVPNSQIVYLADKAAPTAVVEQRFTDFLKRPGPNDWIIVYFEGHGYKTDDTNIPYLATYDVDDNILGWKFRSIPDNIDKFFRGDHAMIMLDDCYSGSMAGAVKAVKRRVSFAVFASSAASKESTGNWTFTEALINGFDGTSYADLNHDGVITLREMADNAQQDMLFGEEQISTTAFTGDFDPNTVIATSQRPATPRIGQRVEAYSTSDSDWYRGFIVADRGTEAKVHYYGYEKADEEWIANNHIRVPHSDSPFKVGDRVEISYKNQWYKGRVLDIKGGSHYVSYDGYDTDENEWVPTKRIRKLTK
ncbi:MAG: hypothetical protein JO314_06745 [Acidobacteria bacterium]|nr:hypothetical protein [Acidobacteriota bacterium]